MHKDQGVKIMEESGQIDLSTEVNPDSKPKRRSRWVEGSGVPRYDKRTYEALAVFVEEAGWHRGARIKNLNEKEVVK